MPNDLAHPAPEQLAAYAAGESGDLDRAGIATHLAGCGECAAEAEAIQAVTDHLATLDEPDPPPGFHDRLVAAVHAELDTPGLGTQGAGAPADPATPEAPADLGAARRRRRGLTRRPLAWGSAAAAALLVAVFGVAQLVDQGGDLTSKDGTTAAAPAPESAAGGATGTAPIPVFRLGGELDLDQLRAAVGSRPELQTAYRAAAGTAGAARQQDSSAEAAAGDASKAPQGLDRCLAAAGPGARPAFFIEGAYQGRPATVLVTVEAQGRLGLYVFGRDDCTTLLKADSAAPPATRAP